MDPKQDTAHNNKWSTLVVRVWREAGDVRLGQVSDPQTGWRAPFHNALELWQLLSNLAAPPVPDDAPLDSEGAGEPQPVDDGQ